MKRNYDKYTDEAKARQNILLTLLNNYGCTNSLNTRRKSELGYIAFPGYRFKAPQGAAFSVAKIVRKMSDEKLIYMSAEFGWYLTAAGVDVARTLCAETEPV